MCPILVLAIDPRAPATLYAGTRYEGVFKSEDGAGTWRAANEGLTIRKIVAIAIDPQTTTTVYVLAPGALFKSTDGAASWIKVTSPADNGLNEIFSLTIDPETPARLYLAGFGVVFKSSDGGITWQAANRGLSDDAFVEGVAIDPATPAVLYTGMAGGGVFKSLDGGGSWKSVSDDLVAATGGQVLIDGTDTTISPVVIDPLTHTTLYASTISGVFKSLDGGKHWRPAQAGLADVTLIMSLAIDPHAPATLYSAPIENGVFKSTNGAEQWVSSSAGLTSLNVQALAIDPLTTRTVYAGTSDGGVSKSLDGGVTWQAASTGLPVDTDACQNGE